MKKQKLFLVSCFSFVICLFMTLGGACAEERRVETVVEPVSIVLDKSSLMMTIGDEQRLTPTVTGEKGAVTYQSQNETVATVDEYGLVTAISEGTTSINALYGGKTASCEISVSLSGMKPSLELVQIANNQANVSLNDCLSLESRVLFNGKYFNDVEVEYTLSNSEVGAIADDVFTPIKVGETSILMKATWRGITDDVTMTREMFVTVQNDVAIYLNSGESQYTLYTKGELQGKTYATSMQCTPHVVINGEEKQAEVTLKEGSDIVALNGNVLTAVQYGTATLTVSCEDETGRYEKDVFINVERPLGVYAGTVVFSALDGDLPVRDIFGEDVELVYAKQAKNELVVKDNKIFNVETNRDSVTNTVIEVYKEDIGYEVSLKAYTKIVDDEDDLIALVATLETPQVDGYFYQTANIVSEKDEHIHTAYWPDTTKTTTNADYGFAGVYEGNGYVIDFVFTEAGLFGNLLDGAIVKDVALLASRNTERSTKVTPCVLARAVGINVTVENLYVQVENNVENSARNATIIGPRSNTLKMKNVLVENEKMFADKIGGVLFFSDAARKTAGLQSNLSNVYVLSTYPFMSRWGDTTCIYAGNDKADSAYTTESGTLTNYTGVTRYDSYAAMVAAGATYKDFNETYWDFSLGVPVWKTLLTKFVTEDVVFLGDDALEGSEVVLNVGNTALLQVKVLGQEIPFAYEIISGGEYIEVSENEITAAATGTVTLKVSYTVGGVDYEKEISFKTELRLEVCNTTYDFSALDGELPIAEIFGGETQIETAYQGARALTVSGNKILGVETNRDGVTQTQIAVYSLEKAYLISLNAYTKILNDASDFNVFNLTEEKVLDGYFYLANDVSLPTAFSHEAYWEKASGRLTFNTAIGFGGVFEGNGYTVSYSFNEWGLFGNVLEGATVQNVKFVATRNAEESGVATANGALARSVVGGQIKNVYANITDELSNPKRNASFIGSREYNTATRKYVVLTNVIVESNDTNSALRGGVLFDTDLARMQKADMLDRNVYVISENTFIANWNPDMTTDFCYANNDSGSYTQNSSKIVQYSYVNRYDNVAAMASVINLVGDWAVSANGIAWAKS